MLPGAGKHKPSAGKRKLSAGKHKPSAGKHKPSAKLMFFSFVSKFFLYFLLIIAKKRNRSVKAYKDTVFYTHS